MIEIKESLRHMTENICCQNFDCGSGEICVAFPFLCCNKDVWGFISALKGSSPFFTPDQTTINKRKNTKAYQREDFWPKL